MPRPNKGPRLVLSKRKNRQNKIYYIVWTENGRSKERSTGTRDVGEAQAAFAEFLQQRVRQGGPRDPAEFPIVEAFMSYGTEHAPHTQSASQNWILY